MLRNLGLQELHVCFLSEVVLGRVPLDTTKIASSF